MDKERNGMENQPGEVIFFSPEMLKLADEKRQQAQERLDACRQAAESGDASAQLQMGLNFLFGLFLTGGAYVTASTDGRYMAPPMAILALLAAGFYVLAWKAFPYRPAPGDKARRVRRALHLTAAILLALLCLVIWAAGSETEWADPMDGWILAWVAAGAALAVWRFIRWRKQ